MHQRIVTRHVAHSSRPLPARAAAAGCDLATPTQLRLGRPSEAFKGLSNLYKHLLTPSERKWRRLAVNAAVAETVAAAPVVFEPHVDGSVLTAQFLVLGLTLGAAAYWWYAVVPTARRTLAKEKRAGALNDYLLELQSNPDKKVQRWFYTDWLQQLERRQQLQAKAAAKRTVQATNSLVSETNSQLIDQHQGQQQGTAQRASNSSRVDGQQPTEQQHENQQPTAEQHMVDHGPDDDRQPSFWSLDNPIIATAAVLCALALFSIVGRTLS